MKNLYILFIWFLLSQFIVSCGDGFLKEEPFSSYNTGLTDPNAIEAELLGLHRIYAELWGWSDRQGFLGCWQLGTDVCVAGATEGVENPFFQYASLDWDNAAVAWMWRKNYEFINNANLIISDVGEENTVAVAEAKFFRALAYHTLVTLWGDIPLLKDAVKTPTFDFTRQSVAEIDKLIEDDLVYAIEYLPNLGEAAKPNRINKDMARQLASESYLRMGMRDNSYYAKAEKTASDIINSGNYQLISSRYGKYLNEGGDYYRDMFRFGNQRRSQGNTEGIWIFEMEYNRDVPGGTIDNPQHRRVWQPAYHKWDGMVNADSLGGRGNGRMRLSNYVKYNIWEGLDGDIRNSNYNIRRWTNYNRPDFSAEIGIDINGFRVSKDDPKAAVTKVVKTGDRAIPYESDSLEVWYPYCTKWGGYDVTDDFGYAIVKDWPIMRLGETYLLRAEARFRQNNNSGAADDINELRKRAFKTAREKDGNNNIGKVDASEINLDFILDERIRELIGEENRRMTLVRTAKLKDRIALYGGDAKPITGFQDYNALLPIPRSEIQLNKEAEIAQNPGYND